MQSVNTDAKLLKDVEEEEWALLGAGVAKQSRTTIKSCDGAFELFEQILNNGLEPQQVETWRGRIEQIWE